MPLCFCFTSLKENEIPNGFESRMSSRVGEILHIPLERITVIVSPGRRICKGGSYDPSVLLQIHCIDVFDAERNPAYFQPVFDFLTSELKIPENRMIVEFVDLPKHMVADGK